MPSGNLLVEYIGNQGIKTTDLEAIHSRWSHPKPGDVVDFSLMGGAYPFHSAPFGTIDSIGDGFCNEDEVNICSHMGSIFLDWDEKKHEPCVSISGGPFGIVKRSRLKPAMALRMQNMWNWGDGLPRAHGGVYYHIERPIFILQPQEPNNKQITT